MTIPLRHVTVVALALAGACVKKDYEQCSSGLLCASPKVCAEPSGLCVSANQVTECENRVDGAGCSLQAARSSLNAIWAFGPADVYAVGDAGVFLHYDGSTWSVVEVEVSSQLNAVWGSSPSNMFAVGDQGTAVHFDGTRWTQLPTDALDSLESVYGVGNEVWVVGDLYIGHYDGTKIEKLDTGTNLNGTDVWASATDSVFVATDSGGVVHFNGSAWELQTTAAPDLEGIWGASATDIFAVGGTGSIEHYDGNVWSPMTSGTMVGLEEVSGSDGSNVFAVGTAGTLLHFDGVEWLPLDTQEDALINSIAITGNKGFAVGEGGLIIEGDSTTWRRAVTDGKCTFHVCLPAEASP